MPNLKRRSVLTLFPLAAAAVTLAACTDNPKNSTSGASGSGGPQEITVTITDDSCQFSSTSFPSGVITFTITNNGTSPNELEILTEDKLQIISEQENIGPGTTAKMTTALKEGTYYGACKPNMVGQLKGVTQLTVTAGAEVAVSEDEAKLREEAVTKYTAYVRDQAGQLLTATQDFVTAYLAGDTAKAQSLYPLARQHYERIEPTAESFGLEQAGDIDEALDARIQDLATDAGKSVTDKEVIDAWTGWHRIEADLWAQDASSPFKFADDASRKAATDQLNAKTKDLYDLVYGNINGTGGKKFELELKDVATGASSLMEEVASTKIVGEEETFSHTDLYDFRPTSRAPRWPTATSRTSSRKRTPRWPGRSPPSSRRWTSSSPPTCPGRPRTARTPTWTTPRSRRSRRTAARPRTRTPTPRSSASSPTPSTP